MIPIFRAQTPNDERLAAQCSALAMIRYGIDEIRTFVDNDVRFLEQY